MGKANDVKKRKGIKVNLLPDAYDSWQIGRVGYTSTVFATASVHLNYQTERTDHHV